jgi:cell division protease FtsH
LTVLVGGWVTEVLTFNEVSTGAADDLARATDLARSMVTEYGMSLVLGPVRLAADPQAAYLAGPGLFLPLFLAARLFRKLSMDWALRAN